MQSGSCTGRVLAFAVQEGSQLTTACGRPAYVCGVQRFVVLLTACGARSVALRCRQAAVKQNVRLRCLVTIPVDLSAATFEAICRVQYDRNLVERRSTP